MSKRGTAEVMGPQRERDHRPVDAAAGQGDRARSRACWCKKQVELAKTELRADVRTEAKVAGGLGVAAVCGIITVTLLLVTAAFALALVMPAWGAGLIVTGVRGGGRGGRRGRELEAAGAPAAARPAGTS